MIGRALIDSAVAVPFNFIAAFLRSPERQRALDRWDPEAGKYAPPIVRHHQPWPGAGQGPGVAQHQPWPHRAWPGGPQ
jgi:hypothetical protein